MGGALGVHGGPWGSLGGPWGVLWGSWGGPWGSLGSPWGPLGGPWGSLGRSLGILGGPWGHQGVLGGTLGVPKGVLGSLGGALLELLGQREIIEKPLVFIAFSQCGAPGGASERALGGAGRSGRKTRSDPGATLERRTELGGKPGVTPERPWSAGRN